MAKKKPGPKEDHLVLNGDWEESVEKALGKTRPKDWLKEKKDSQKG